MARHLSKRQLDPQKIQYLRPLQPDTCLTRLCLPQYMAPHLSKGSSIRKNPIPAASTTQYLFHLTLPATIHGRTPVKHKLVLQKHSLNLSRQCHTCQKGIQLRKNVLFHSNHPPQAELHLPTKKLSRKNKTVTHTYLKIP